MSKVDFTKPVRFAPVPAIDRTLVRIVAHDLPGKYPVCAILTRPGLSEYANTFPADAFENIPPEPTVRYVNVYEGEYDYDTRALADHEQDRSRRRIACVRVTGDQFDE